jgi:hypothetical protein
LSDPYHTASARPGPPAFIHGNTLTASPVATLPSLTRTGLVHVRQPEAAEAAETQTWLSEGFAPLTHQTANRLRARSIETTLNNVSGEPGRPLTMWISFE